MAKTSFTGPVASANGFEGTLTGNVTGNVTGNLVGSVTGNVTGTASAVSGIVAATALVIPTSTSALLGDKTAAVNTTNKTAGSAVYNTTTKTIYVAQIGGATGDWIDSADGNTTITPA